MSHEDAFIKALSRSSMRKHAAPSFLSNIKNEVVTFVRQNKPALAGAAIGAAGLTALQYKWNRQPSSGGPSATQRAAQAEMEVARRAEAEARASGRDLSFSRKMRGAAARAGREVSGIMAEHPLKGAALVAVPTGAAVGHLAAKIIYRK